MAKMAKAPWKMSCHCTTECHPRIPMDTLKHLPKIFRLKCQKSEPKCDIMHINSCREWYSSLLGLIYALQYCNDLQRTIKQSVKTKIDCVVRRDMKYARCHKIHSLAPFISSLAVPLALVSACRFRSLHCTSWKVTNTPATKMILPSPVATRHPHTCFSIIREAASGVLPSAPIPTTGSFTDGIFPVAFGRSCRLLRRRLCCQTAFFVQMCAVPNLAGAPSTVSSFTSRCRAPRNVSTCFLP